jgi:hypothetical protein
MVFKWALVMFAAMTIGLVVLSKALAFFNPPRPGRARPPWLRSVERAARFSILLPAALALVLLAVAMLGG